MVQPTVLISGLGSIGLRHARNLKSCGITDIIGYDPNAERRASFEAEMDSDSSDDFENCLKKKPDLVVIASPNSFHIQQSILAARHGCNLLIEKPLGTNNTNVPQLIRTIEEKKLFVHVGSNWKFHPAFIKMKQLINDGDIGNIFSSRVHGGYWLPDWHPWEDYRKTYSARKDLGGGIEFDAHELDAIAWLLSPIKSIKSMAKNTGNLEIDTNDIAIACLHHENGNFTTLQMDYLYPVYRRRYEIAGTKGVIEWDFHDGLKLIRKNNETVNFPEGKLDDLNEMYVLQTQHVLDGIKGLSSPVTSVKDANRIMNLQIEISET
ncbi:Gfo/Idh/MocA family oxidoreductase [Kiloniella laminariae]|uniref:Gfo/Idh/MocA family oxidoreductase n=1 Tax=Kiloniella laminariae TaxID=454162 RepID=A0ABT4LMI4_9PROT|nr:Gfo/Idh/MocA family oxidoreductase [Kiloniella laminariae]MCZ4282350.1 Gfo/Idh/MocA family oxidoreductase [Kiloniella laminariae]